ncbi:MAG: FAD:protein FMN transferase, partial [Coriobacteriales bacterium]|nr:FAD:protein FMN transferase [Coriobacteriales bacterium]
MIAEGYLSSDSLPLESSFQLSGPDESGAIKANFFAFNTVITMQAYGIPELCQAALTGARDECRRFERLFSRTLPHSEITQINQAKGAFVEISKDTYLLLEAARYYCAESRGLFDITIGSATRLWDFNKQIIPDAQMLQEALKHVNYQALQLHAELEQESTTTESHVSSNTTSKFYAQLTDPDAAIDAGGIAKGYIADCLTETVLSHGITNFLINLGGNTVVRGTKPNGASWRVGIQNPLQKESIVGAVDITDVSLVTSGIYERCFEQGGAFYHHILSPQSGFPVQTDAAGVTVIAKRSIDAEGFSTTLLAMGIKAGIEFARSRSEIINA